MFNTSGLSDERRVTAPQFSHRQVLRCLAMLAILSCLFITAACGGSVQGSTGGSQGAASVTATSTAPGATPTSDEATAPPAPAWDSADLRVPGNFVLVLPLQFTLARGVSISDSGVTPLDEGTIRNEITEELRHLLFVIDSSSTMKIYSPGVTPVTAHLGRASNGGLQISYTQNVDSQAGTVSITFEGTLLKDQLTIHYEQYYNPSAFINANASDVVVTLSAHIRWVAASEIPAAPRNGAYHFAADGAIVLTWQSGQHAVAYEIYRQISDVDQQFRPLATVSATSYTDSSSLARQNLHSMKGIVYAIFSVGPTGVENPGPIVVAIPGQASQG
ncbi:hypothetical protein [Thermogemmatispora sp.]|uniref:hypothetical protein n=1 Tax=Thermogemmatispora sp. TaxID=1968838 RepID=UPI0035E43A0B